MTELRSFVVGGAGFIGSHLTDRLVERGPVTIYDNLSVGRRAFVASHLASGRATLVEADALDLERLTEAMAGHDLVVHLAANPEARWGLARTRLDLDQGTIATYNVLEAMRRTAVSRLIFSSSGTVYGDTARRCAEGDLGALPISLYGASKLAGEALISAYVECFGLTAWIYRFGNVVGPRGTHGAALDFLKKLRDRRTELEVLGDGRQSKPYLDVRDCVEGMLFGFDQARERLNIHNLAPEDATSVSRIAELCVAASPYPDAVIRYQGGERGWPGDVPRSRMDPGKLAALGFRVRHTSDEAVRMAVEALASEVFGGELARRAQ
ncbi:NAD-dependent epimerase/dehydratase family protein [Sorangium sp. So ce426]|uniref:NAD-dependent epimerase/dehydratase family protein n=1 Tax=unclassified Sorangium TaxID=2621164 RepID=UPI003F5B7F2F